MPKLTNTIKAQLKTLAADLPPNWQGTVSMGKPVNHHSRMCAVYEKEGIEAVYAYMEGAVEAVELSIQPKVVGGVPLMYYKPEYNYLAEAL